MPALLFVFSLIGFVLLMIVVIGLVAILSERNWRADPAANALFPWGVFTDPGLSLCPNFDWSGGDCLTISILIAARIDVEHAK